MTTSVTLATARHPGPIAIIHINGPKAKSITEKVTGRNDWEIGRMQLVDFAKIDRGIAVRLGEDIFQWMPHGGLRVVRDLLDHLYELGAENTPPDTPDIYPEAKTALEADLLAVMSSAASPAAIDVLLDQPRRWERWLNQPDLYDTAAVIKGNHVLNRLLQPASIVVVGRPNVGKSTLLNRLVGRTASLVADLPGTTRDWVGSLVELSPTGDPNTGLHDAVAVRWLDTPGIRITDDPIEQDAIELAAAVVRTADLIISIRDPDIGWLDHYPADRDPDLWVTNKIDMVISTISNESPSGDDHQSPLGISAKTGAGIDRLQQMIIEKLGVGSIPNDMPWAFSQALRGLLETHNLSDLTEYVTGTTPVTNH